MKRILVLLVALCTFNCTISAQELTKKMFNIYHGQPRTLVQSSSMAPMSMTIEFDRSGRVLSKSGGDGKMVYEWSSDGKSVEVKAYNNGQLMGSAMIYIETMTDNLYKYTADGVNIEVSFRSNGSINKMVMSGGGQTMTTTYYYNSSNDVYPYKIVTAGGGQFMSMNISNVKTDSKGNWIQCTQSAQGQSMTNNNQITYY